MARDKEEGNPDPKVRVAVKAMGNHGSKEQENPKVPARVEARVRVNPSQHRAQVPSPVRAEIAMLAQVMFPATCSSPYPVVCRRRYIVQAAEDAKWSM